MLDMIAAMLFTASAHGLVATIRPLRAAAAPGRHETLSCGPRVRIISPGKTKESWLEEAIGIYTKDLVAVRAPEQRQECK